MREREERKKQRERDKRQDRYAGKTNGQHGKKHNYVNFPIKYATFNRILGMSMHYSMLDHPKKRFFSSFFLFNFIPFHSMTQQTLNKQIEYYYLCTHRMK